MENTNEESELDEVIKFGDGGKSEKISRWNNRLRALAKRKTDAGTDELKTINDEIADLHSKISKLQSEDTQLTMTPDDDLIEDADLEALLAEAELEEANKSKQITVKGLEIVFSDKSADWKELVRDLKADGVTATHDGDTYSITGPFEGVRKETLASFSGSTANSASDIKAAEKAYPQIKMKTESVDEDLEEGKETPAQLKKQLEKYKNNLSIAKDAAAKKQMQGFIDDIQLKLDALDEAFGKKDDDSDDDADKKDDDNDGKADDDDGEADDDDSKGEDKDKPKPAFLKKEETDEFMESTEAVAYWETKIKELTDKNKEKNDGTFVRDSETLKSLDTMNMMLKKAKAKTKHHESYSDDLAALTEGDESLSEDFKTKAAIIFEAALTEKVRLETERLQEEFDNKLIEESAKVRDELAEKVDNYLTYAVESWVEDNKIAIESGLRTEVAESFIEALKGVFVEHYIEVPEGKKDIVAELETKLSEVQESLCATTAKEAVLSEQVETLLRDKIISEASESLADTQQARLQSLAQDVVFVDEESFRKKVSVIKECYFKGKPMVEEVEDKSSFQTTETIVEEIGDENAELSPTMKNYLKALSRSAKAGA